MTELNLGKKLMWTVGLQGGWLMMAILSKWKKLHPYDLDGLLDLHNADILILLWCKV